MVASGTSTPTSITVVATSSWRRAGGKSLHRRVFLGAFHAAVHQIDAGAEFLTQLLVAFLRRGKVDLLGFIDQRADPVDALALVERAADRLLDLADARERNGAGVDRLAAGRLLAQFRDIHVTEIGQHQSARDRRRGEHQHVDSFAFLRQRQPLVHAEAVLLVDDGEREIVEGNVLLEQGMGAEQEIDVAEGEPVEDFLARRSALAAGEDGDMQARRFGQRLDGVEVLAGEDFGRRHEGGLPAGLDHGRRRQQRHHGLAGADIALQQPQHALRQRQVVDDVVERFLLRVGERSRAAP